MIPAWIDRLERRLGFLAVPGLAAFLTAMSAAVGLLSQIKPEFPGRLALEPDLLLQGEAWRALTFIFVPPSMGPLWLVFWLLLFYAYVGRLEAVWGDFKLTLYCLFGAAGSVAASLASGQSLSNGIFELSLFLAFARLFPDFEILLFFVVPVRMKWLGWLTWAGVTLGIAFGGSAERLAYVLGFLNYFLFFGRDVAADARYLARRLRRRL